MMIKMQIYTFLLSTLYQKIRMKMMLQEDYGMIMKMILEDDDEDDDENGDGQDDDDNHDGP